MSIRTDYNKLISKYKNYKNDPLSTKSTREQLLTDAHVLRKRMVDQVNIVSVSGLPYEKKLQGIDNLRKLIQRVNFVIRKTDSEKIEKKVALSSRKVEVKNPSILSKFLQRIYNYVASVFKSLHGAKLF